MLTVDEILGLMGQRGGLIIIVIFLVVLIGVSAGGFYLYSNRTTSMPSPVPSTESFEVSERNKDLPDMPQKKWTEYSNFDLDFTFSYPSDFNLNEKLRSIHPEGVTGNIFIQNWDSAKEKPSAASDFQMIIWIEKNYPVNGVIPKLEESYDSRVFTSVDTKKLVPVMVGDKEGLKGEVVMDGKTVPVIWAAYGDEIISITLATISPANMQLFDEIVKTFKGKSRDSAYLQRIFESNSPSGGFKVTHLLNVDSPQILIKDKNNKITAENALVLNEQALKNGAQKLGMTGMGQQSYQFKDWISNSVFVLGVLRGDGTEFEVAIDAKTGLVDEASFRKIK